MQWIKAITIDTQCFKTTDKEKSNNFSMVMFFKYGIQTDSVRSRMYTKQ